MSNDNILSVGNFWNRAEKAGLLAMGDFVVVAVSGGADSSALLHLLHSLSREKKLTLVCAHVNHNLRGEESQRDENFVRGLCKEYDIPCRVFSTNVSAFAAEHRLSTEEAGRKLRYCFFEECAAGLSPGAKIATAHSLSDCIETFIFNAARGTSLEGLCGIPLQRGRVIRPLLDFSRGEIERYCSENGVPFVTDSTNLKDGYTRNKIRHGVTPVLKEVNPDFEAAFRRLFENLRESRNFIDEKAAAGLQAAKLPEGWASGPLCGLEPPVKKRAAALILERLGFEVSAKRVNLLAENFGGEDFKAELSKGKYLIQKNGVISKEEQKIKKPYIAERKFSPGKVALTNEKMAEIELFSYDEFKNSHKINHYDLKYTFDYGKISNMAVIRSRREGDKIDIHGGTKTLKKLFIEKNIPSEERDYVMVVADGKGALWVEGLGAARRARLSEKTKTVVVIKILQNKNPDAEDAVK